MQDRPTAVELLEAVAEFLEEGLGGLPEAALRYKVRVAANVVRIVAREIEFGERYLWEEARELAGLLGGASPAASTASELRERVLRWNRQLVERIRSGEFDTGEKRSRVLAALRRVAVRKLEIANPRYLKAAKAQVS